MENKLYRYELIGNSLTNPKLLLQLPTTPGPENNGGHLIIGPDDNLYLIIGNVMDASNETVVQTLTQNFVTGSKADGRSGILRINQDGLPVMDSKNGAGILGQDFPTNLYHAYGIHNGFGLDFDPVTGYLWDTETGHNIYNDEINLVMPGFNSGFGVVQGMSIFSQIHHTHWLISTVVASILIQNLYGYKRLSLLVSNSLHQISLESTTKMICLWGRSTLKKFTTLT